MIYLSTLGASWNEYGTMRYFHNLNCVKFVILKAFVLNEMKKYTIQGKHFCLKHCLDIIANYLSKWKKSLANQAQSY